MDTRFAFTYAQARAARRDEWEARQTIRKHDPELARRIDAVIPLLPPPECNHDETVSVQTIGDPFDVRLCIRCGERVHVNP